MGCKGGGSESAWVGNGHGPCGIWPFGKGSPSTADKSRMENCDLLPQSFNVFMCSSVVKSLLVLYRLLCSVLSSNGTLHVLHRSVVPSLFYV